MEEINLISLNEEYKQALKGKKFIDLFCGLGGFRLALESYGAECVFSSDIDNHVSKVYEKRIYPFLYRSKNDIDYIGDARTDDLYCVFLYGNRIAVSI